MAKTYLDELFESVAFQVSPGHFGFTKFGYNTDIDAGVEEDIVSQGGIYVPPSDSGVAVQAVSNNIADTYILTIEGLNPAGYEQKQDITLNGTTPVAVPGLWRRINRAYNGNGTEYVGVVQVTDAATGLVVYSDVQPADQQTNQLFYTVPKGKTATLHTVAASINKSGGTAAQVIFRVRARNVGGVFRTVVRFGLGKTGTSAVVFNKRIGGLFNELTDIKMSALSDAADTDCSGLLDFLLIDNKLIK